MRAMMSTDESGVRHLHEALFRPGTSDEAQAAAEAFSEASRLRAQHEPTVEDDDDGRIYSGHCPVGLLPAEDRLRLAVAIDCALDAWDFEIGLAVLQDPRYSSIEHAWQSGTQEDGCVAFKRQTGRS